MEGAPSWAPEVVEYQSLLGRRVEGYYFLGKEIARAWRPVLMPLNVLLRSRPRC